MIILEPFYTLYQKFETYFSRNETARPCSQFLHSCICERELILGIYKSLTDTYINVEIGRQQNNIIMFMI
jgi:hypothetical protein